MFPVAAGAKGQPPMPASEASRIVAPARTAVTAFAMPVFRVLWKCSRGARLDAERPHDLEAPLDVARDGDADRVGDRDLVGADLGDPGGDRGERLGRDLALERAAERDRDRDREPDAVGGGALAQRSSTVRDCVVDRHALVPRWPNVSVALTTVFTAETPAASARS